MSFFNLHAAHVLHHISLALEIFGFSLAVFEIWWSDRARAVETAIEKFGDSPWRSLWEILYTRVGGGPAGNLTGAAWIQGLAALGGAAWLGYETKSWLQGALTFLGLTLAFIVLEFLALVIGSRLVRIFRRLAKGKALGGFGISIAATGVLMETYQVIIAHVT